MLNSTLGNTTLADIGASSVDATVGVNTLSLETDQKSPTSNYGCLISVNKQKLKLKQSQDYYALDFDGSNYVLTDVDSEVDYLFADSNSFWSWGGWFKGSHGIIGGLAGGIGTATTNAIYMDNGDLKIRLRGTENDNLVESNVDTSKWNFVYVTWDGSTAYGYFNDQNPVEIGVGTADVQDDWDFGIADPKDGTVDNFERFDGEIDDVHIYDRALSENEITDLYKNKYKELGDEVGHWKMNEGEGCTVYDSSGNENHGTLEPNCPTDSPEWIKIEDEAKVKYDYTVTVNEQQLEFAQPNLILAYDCIVEVNEQQLEFAQPNLILAYDYLLQTNTQELKLIQYNPSFDFGLTVFLNNQKLNVEQYEPNQSYDYSVSIPTQELEVDEKDINLGYDYLVIISKQEIKITDKDPISRIGATIQPSTQNLAITQEDLSVIVDVIVSLLSQDMKLSEKEISTLYDYVVSVAAQKLEAEQFDALITLSPTVYLNVQDLEISREELVVNYDYTVSIPVQELEIDQMPVEYRIAITVLISTQEIKTEQLEPKTLYDYKTALEDLGLKAEIKEGVIEAEFNVFPWKPGGSVKNIKSNGSVKNIKPHLQ